MASLMCPSQVIGIAINSRLLNERQAEEERQKVLEQIGLPVCDVIRNGPDELIDAVLDFKRSRKVNEVQL
jgi:uncharacterized NAD-dependent epimerase/dehydratase family protein